MRLRSVSLAIATLLAATAPVHPRLNPWVTAPSPTAISQHEKPSEESGIKVLAEDRYSTQTTPFLAVVRDQGTYTELRKIVPALPVVLDDFFKQNVVVAAFMGQRSSAGYSIEFTRDARGLLHVVAKGPAKGSMTAAVITSPAKVVSIPEPRWYGLEADMFWKSAMSLYRVTRGNFSMIGGFAGRRADFGLTGDLLLMREGNLATFLFNLENADGSRDRHLKETITGVVKSSATTIPAMSPDALIEVPHSKLSANGKFTNQSKSLELTFKSHPLMIADGYSGEGWLEAEVVAGSKKVEGRP